MFKIEKLTVNNFKNIVETEVEIGDFNVVVGPNNSGKSSFLQVIPFLRWLINGDIKEVESCLIEGSFQGFINFFKNDSIDQNLKLLLEYTNVITRNFFSYELQLKSLGDTTIANLSIAKEVLTYKNKNTTGKAKLIFKRSDNKVDFGQEFSQTKLIEQIPAHASVLRYLNLIAKANTGPKNYGEAFSGFDEILNAPIYFFSSSELRKQTGDKPKATFRYRSIYTDIEGNIRSLKDSDKWSRFKDILKEILYITDIKFVESNSNEKTNPTIFLVQGSKAGGVLIDELSDGTLIILSLITEVLTSKTPLLLIEEPENSLHPRALTGLIRFLQSNSPEKQFILTTHSPALLNLVKPEDVIVARLGADGNSTLEKIKNLKELKRKLNKGYVSFGDLLIDNIDEDDQGEEKEY